MTNGKFDAEFMKIALVSLTDDPDAMFQEMHTVVDSLRVIILKAMEHGYEQRSGADVLDYFSQWVLNIYAVTENETPI